MTTRIYVGFERKGGRVRFRSATTPTMESHGARYFAVMGPFRTVAGAETCIALPLVQTVSECERIARRQTVHAVDGTAYNEAYRAGWNLRRFEGANAPDKYGTTRADYLRADVRGLERKIAEINAEIARLEA